MMIPYKNINISITAWILINNLKPNSLPMLCPAKNEAPIANPSVKLCEKSAARFK